MPLVVVFAKFDQIIRKASNNAGENDYRRVRAAYRAFVLAISGSFNEEWGRDIWRVAVKDDQRTFSVDQACPGLPLIQNEATIVQTETTVYHFRRYVRNFFESKIEGDFIGSKVQRTRIRGCIETVASLVFCADVKLDSFGEVADVLSKVGVTEQTNDSSIRLNPLFTVRWTCLSLVVIKQIVDDKRLQDLVKLVLDGLTPFQTDLDSRDTEAMALTAVQNMDDDLRKAWEAVLDLRLALEPWSQNKYKTESEIRNILSQKQCEASIQELERIAMEAVGLKEIDWRFHFFQENMDEVTHKLIRRLPGVFFDSLQTAPPSLTSEALDLPSVKSTPIPPQLVFPRQQLQSMSILGQRLRDITKRRDTEWDEETLKSLKYLREVPIQLCGLGCLMERQLWRLVDLRDGSGLGFTVELFFLALRQLLSASPPPDKSSSSEVISEEELKKVFYTGTFDVIKSNWRESKNSAGTQRILLDILSDLLIQGRGIFSDFRYPPYIVEMLLDLVGKMVQGLGLERGLHPHIDDLLDDLMDESPMVMKRMNTGLRDEALNTIYRSLTTMPS